MVLNKVEMTRTDVRRNKMESSELETAIDAIPKSITKLNNHPLILLILHARTHRLGTQHPLSIKIQIPEQPHHFLEIPRMCDKRD